MLSLSYSASPAVASVFPDRLKYAFGSVYPSARVFTIVTGDVITCVPLANLKGRV